MKKAYLGVLILFVFAVARGFAMVDGQQVLYLNGTSPMKADALGRFVTADDKTLIFEAGSDRIQIPYAGISDVRYHHELTRHLGVLPAIAVGLVRHRERRHFLSFQWKDTAGMTQQATFEVAKTAPNGLLAVIRARSPQATCQAVLHDYLQPCTKLP